MIELNEEEKILEFLILYYLNKSILPKNQLNLLLSPLSFRTVLE